MSSIPVGLYLKNALSLTKKEIDLRKQFSKWLPKELIDSHSHTAARKQCKFIDASFLSRVSSTFPWFEIEKHKKVDEILYPNSEIRKLVFSIPHRGINHRSANIYILRHSIKDSSIIPVLYGLPDNIDYTLSKIKTKKFYGLKMYHAYFSPPARTISQYFPDRILRCCENEDIPIILHLPKNVIESRNELIAVVKRFPNLKIVLAHMGMAYLPVRKFKKVLSTLHRYENIYLDTALVTSSVVFEIAIKLLGYHRILFGTDQPFNLVRGKFFFNKRGEIRLATTYPYHWICPEEQKKIVRCAINGTTLHWQILLALQEAIYSYGENKDIKDCIFRKNAKKVFGLK